MKVPISRRMMLPTVVLAAFTVGVVTAQEIELNPGPPDIPAGLVSAFEVVGQKVVGAAKFFVEQNPGPPDAPNPSLDVWVDQNPNVPTHINVFQNPGPPNMDGSPGAPRTWLRITLAGGVVTLEQESAAGIGDPTLRLEPADLSLFLPPNPFTPTR